MTSGYADLAISSLRLAADRTVLLEGAHALTGAEAVRRIAYWQDLIKACSAGLERITLAMLARNSSDAWLVQIAAMALGGTVVWLHPRGSLQDHDLIVSDAQPNVLALGTGGAVADNLRSNDAWQGRVIDLAQGEHDRSGAACGSPVVLARPDDVALLSYTGGTTGRPKAVVRTQADWAVVARAVVVDFDFPENVRFLAAGPISHVTGTKVLPALMTGGDVLMLSDGSAEDIADAIEAFEVGATLLVPTALADLVAEIERRPRRTTSLKRLFYGGAASTPSVLRRAARVLGPVLHQVYGQAEGYPLCSLAPLEHDVGEPDRWRSCGRPVASVDVRLVDAAGNPVAAGEVGEIVARGRQVMQGYKDLPEASRATVQDSWLHTGDLAREQPDGCLEIVGRLRDMVVTGGFNVYCRDVEIALETHPSVRAAAVYGVVDARWGEAVTASVVLHDGRAEAAEALIDWVKRRKGSFQAPKRLEIVGALPTTAVGKIDKKALAARWAVAADLAR